MSLGIVEDGITLTLVASDEQLAALDAVQYVDGGPCVAAADDAEPVGVAVPDLLDEGRWQLYARSSAAVGVASTLSLPVIDGERAVGSVNLYASSTDAFVGHHDALARAVGADAASAVANADLSFRTRKQAMAAPEKIREGNEINVALGIIAEAHGVNMPVARERLRNAAARAGISEEQAARAIRSLRGL